MTDEPQYDEVTGEPAPEVEGQVLIPVPEGLVDGPVYGSREARDHWDERLWRHMP